MTAPVPNFLVIGAAKAGTTSLYDWLGQHPEVFVPRQKGLHFFASDWLQQNANGPGDTRLLQTVASTWESYLAHFREAGVNRAIGDCSPSYFAWWPSREAIRDRLPGVKIILLLRDPVQKAFSQYTHLIRDGRESLSFWEALQAEPERKAHGYGALWRYRESACYAEPTERFLEYFGPDRMRVYFFEELVRDSGHVLREVFRFLGVSEHAPITTSEARHRSGKPRSRVLALVVNHPRLRRFSRKILPAHLVARVGAKVTELNTGAKPLLDDRSRAFLLQETRADKERLARILGRPLPWPG
jgi:hypothetical protein